MAAGLFAGLWAAPAGAVTYTLGDGNSDVSVDFDGGYADRSGVLDWYVDDVNHLYEQWFWVRLRDREVRIEELGTYAVVASDTNPFDDDRDDTLVARFGGAQFDSPLQVDLKLSLQGGNFNSGTADLAEQIRLTNVGNDVLTVSFFQYADFDLGGEAYGDVVELLNPNTVRQSGKGWKVEEVMTPAPDVAELNFFPITVDDRLDDLDLDDLVANGGPLGPSDVTWALQWTFTLDPRQSVLISKDKLIMPGVPEPATAALLALGLAGLVARRTRK
jgi:hypothetical protein